MNKYKFEKQLNEFINGKSGGLCVPFFNKFIKNESDYKKLVYNFF